MNPKRSATTALNIDLSALEARILAARQGAFDALTGRPIDPYRIEAAKAFGVAEAEVTPEQRAAVKRVAYFRWYTPTGTGRAESQPEMQEFPR